MFATIAWAQDAAAAAPALGAQLLGYAPLVAVLALFYFMVLRPQTQQAQKTAAFLQTLKPGMRVCVGGAIVGKVARVEADSVEVECGGGAMLTVLKTAITEPAGPKMDILPPEGKASKSSKSK